GVAAQNGRAAALRGVGDHDRQGGLHHAVDLDPDEACRGVGVEGGDEDVPLVADVPVERLPQGRVADHDEVPRLGQTDTGRRVGGGEDPVEDLGRDRCAGELAVYVPAAVDDVVQVVGHGQAPAALRPR